MKPKTTLKRCLWVMICILFAGVFQARAQNPTYTLRVKNFSQPTTSQLEFDIYLKATGVEALSLNYVQLGINVNSAIKGTGTMTATRLAGTTQLIAPQGSSATTYTASSSQFRVAAGIAAAGANTVIQIGDSVRIGRFRLTNTLAFVSNTQPNLVFSYVVSGTTTKTDVAAFVQGATLGSIITTSGTHFIDENPILNAPSCTAATLSSVITNQTCSNVNNGAIDLTATGGSPAPSFAWTKVGGGFNAVSEDISGLAPGDYTVVATSGTCSSTATYTVGAGVEATTVPSTVSACGSYTWPQNGQTYTASGTYTAVSGCTTYELTLNVTPIPVQPTLACYETATFNNTTCSWDVTGTQPVQPTLACYQTATFNNTTCSWDVTGTQPVQPTLACYETATFNTTTCSWDVTGTQPVQPTLACYETATFNTTTCSWDVTGTQPVQPTLACYQTATFNNTTCSWDVTGTQPVQPTLACYETATFNNTTCSWDVTGTQPVQPTLACYETATFNTTTCSWDVTGTQPVQPTLACYETATFNTTTCSWDVTGTQPVQPTLACYQTATFNTTTCSWDVTGTMPVQPTLACYQTATFNTTTCSWDVTGTQPVQPTLACYETATFNNTTCSWDVTGTQPVQPTLACYETATFNTTTCSWDVTGTQPVQPTLACYQTATFNNTTCSWDVTGTQPVQPTLACYQTATFNTTTCSWDVTGTQPVQPTLACYQTATFNNTTCSWDVTGEPNPVITTTASACDLYTWTVNGQTYTASGTYSYSSNCQDYSLVLTITGVSSTNTSTVTACGSYTWSANGTTYTQSGSYTYVSGCNTEILNLTVTPIPAQPTLACYETATFNSSTCSWDVTGTQPAQPTLACYETATFNNTTCSWDVTGTQPVQPTLACYETATFNNTTCSWDVTGTMPVQPTLACYQTATFNNTTCSWDVTGEPNPVITTTATSCDTYVWSVNGQTYAASGTYSYSSNCQDYSLVLTINTSVTYYADADLDGYGDANSPVTSCTGMPSGAVANSGDCNDNNGNINPGATEVCGNGIDDNCDGNVDEGCGCTNPPTANAGLNASVCEGQTVSLNGTIGGGANNATWTSSGSGSFSPSANVLNATYVPSSADYAAGSVTLTLTTDATAPCTAATSSMTVTFNALPSGAGAISGTTAICNPLKTLFTYSVAAVQGASSYTWTVPVGATIIGSSNGTSISVRFVDANVQVGINGPITVTPNNSNGCGNPAPSVLNISVNITVPVTPPSISGATKVCPGDIVTYSIANVARATSYNWSVPSGASILSGAGSNVITVQYTSVVGGTLSVIAVNSCGTSPARTATITQNILPAAASISGPIDGLCGLTGVVYSVTPVSGAVSYVWTVPSGASIVGSSSGSSIVVDFSGSFTTGSVTVAASNNCGTGLVRSLSVKAVPGLPGAISGPTTACTSSSGNVYSISTVSGATSYTWTVPGGATINSGQGSKIISVTFGSVPSSTGIVTVKASNACGLSAVKVLSVATINCPRVGTTTSLSMVAYPNPVSTELTVEFGSESAQNANITLRDAAGRIVYAESKAAAEGFNSAKVSVDGLASGIYMLQLQMNDRTEQIKVFVTK